MDVGFGVEIGGGEFGGNPKRTGDRTTVFPPLTARQNLKNYPEHRVPKGSGVRGFKVAYCSSIDVRVVEQMVGCDKSI